MGKVQRYLLGGNASGVTHGGGLLLPTTHLSQTGRSCRSGKDLCEYAKRHQAKLITSADAGTSYRPDLPPARPLNTSTSPVNKHTADHALPVSGEPLWHEFLYTKNTQPNLLSGVLIWPHCKP